MRLSVAIGNLQRTKKLEIGSVFLTPKASRALVEANESPDEFVARHESSDWGEVGSAESMENELSLKKGFRIMSGYTLSTGKKVWIITEADRSATTLLLPEEY